MLCKVKEEISSAAAVLGRNGSNIWGVKTKTKQNQYSLERLEKARIDCMVFITA